MFLRFILSVVSLMSFLSSLDVSGCDENCADNPQFTPSRLVVKHGDPTSASCSVCRHACIGSIYDLESPVGDFERNGTTIKWTIDKLTEWEISPTCYYTNSTGYQCCSVLPLTLYQPPDNVSISFVDHTGPMLEGHQYTLQCSVQDVAPVENLIVTFYRGQTALDRQQSNGTNPKPVTEIFTLNINASKEDDGAQYWCEAKLELGPEGPQPPPVVKSQSIDVTVCCLKVTTTRLPPTTTPTTTTTTTTPTTTTTTTTPATTTTTTTTTPTTTTPTTTPTTTMTTTTTATTATTTTTTTIETPILPSCSTSSMLLHRFIMCFMLLFPALI